MIFKLMVAPHKLDRLTSLMFATGRRIRERHGAVHGDYHATFLRVETLRYVAEAKKPTMKDVAAHLCITSSSATSLINDLVDLKLLKRAGDAADRRVRRLAVTPAGRREAAEGMRRITERMKHVFSHLNDREITELSSILEKLVAIYR